MKLGHGYYYVQCMKISCLQHFFHPTYNNKPDDVICIVWRCTHMQYSTHRLERKYIVFQLFWSVLLFSKPIACDNFAWRSCVIMPPDEPHYHRKHMRRKFYGIYEAKTPIWSHISHLIQQIFILAWMSVSVAYAYKLH